MQFINPRLLNMNFPAMQVADELIEKVKSHPVTVITAPTGSGKTVALVPALAHEFASKGNRVTCTQNKRRLAVSAAEYAAYLSQKELGFEVGYRIGGEKLTWGKETFLEYVTTDIVLNQYLLVKNNLAGIGILVIDEAHEQTSSQILLISLAKKLLKDRPDFRLVIMSATLDEENINRYKDFFGPEKVAIVEAPGAAVMYPVERKYANKENALPDITSWDKYFKEDIYPAILSKIKKYHANNDSDILVFLPGIKQITCLGKILKSSNIPWQPLYGSMSMDMQASVARSTPGKYKVILATNIARSGITFTNLKYVISSKVSRSVYFDIQKDLPTLDLTWTDKASLEQEAGRTGRTCPGIAYAAGNAVTDNKQAPASITLEDFTPILLKLLAAGLTPGDIEWLVKPPLKLIVHAYRTLRELEAVKNNEITETGLEMAGIPLSPRMARVLVEAARLGVTEKVINKIISAQKTPENEVEELKERLLERVENIQQTRQLPAQEAMARSFLTGYFNHVSVVSSEYGYYTNGNFKFKSTAEQNIIIPINSIQVDGTVRCKDCIPATLADIEVISKEKAKEIQTLIDANITPEQRLLQQILQKKDC